MNGIVNADYMIVQERTLSVIVSEILTIERNVYSVALDGAIQIGQRLHEAKAQVEHGDWENWCKQNLNYSHSQATRFMKIATEYGDENSPYSKIATSQDFSISKALELLKVPEDEVETFAENNDIESDTVKELREKIKALNAEKESLADEKKDAYDTAAKAEAEFSKLRVAKIEAEEQVQNAAAEIESLKAELQKAKENGGDPEKLKAMEEKLSAAEAEIEAQKEKAKKLKEKAKAEKEKKDEEINAAVEAARSEARQQALAESGVTELEAKIASLEKKLANSADDNKVRFKVLVDDVQDTWNSCVYLAQSDESGNMLKALGIVLQHMSDQLK